MEYERIKAENEVKKLVQEAQEKVMFPSFPFGPAMQHINVYGKFITSLGKREACKYQSYEIVKNFKWRK